MKKIFLFGLTLCALTLAAAEARAAAGWQGRGDASVYYREGARFALEGRLDEAAAAFEHAVRLDPKNGDAFFSLGNVYSEQGRWADAVAAYRKAIALRKRDGEAYNNLGVALGRRGEYERAAGAFEQAIEIFPQWAEPRFHLSQVYKLLGRDIAAQAAYAEALARRPDYATHPPRTVTPARTDPAPRAETASVTTTPTPAPAPPTPRPAEPAPARPEPDDAAALYEIGLRHQRGGRHAEAVAALRRAVLLDRNNAAAHSALGAAYASLGRWRESVDAYEQSVRLDPKDAEAFERLGRSYAKLRETTPPAGDAAEGARAASTAPAEPSPTPRPAAYRAEADPTAVYRVGPGDVLEVRVNGARNAPATNSTVSATGLLDYPRLPEPLKVEGLTTDEIASRLGAELKRAGAAPSGVTVGVSEYVSHAVIVSGLVKDPGTKILRREGIPLYVIVAHAQPLPEAGQAAVTAKATGRTTAVNLRDEAAMKMLVRPGDVIDVQTLPKQFYYVAGAVRQPGQKEFHLGLTLTQAVLAAGGASAREASIVAVTRQGEYGRLTTTRYDLNEIRAGRVPDPILRPGDRVEVQR